MQVPVTSDKRNAIKQVVGVGVASPISNLTFLTAVSGVVASFACDLICSLSAMSTRCA